MTIPSSDGVKLEIKWDLPETPERTVVLCHPHPQHGGTMTAPLMRAVAKYLYREGMAVLRFNFRGVGASTGEWGDGHAEIDDVEAAFTHAVETYPDLPMGLAGWSFGAATALRWQARTGNVAPYVGIAPPVHNELTPVLPDPGELAPAQRTFILGDRDQFITVDDLQAYADSIAAELTVLEGSDHFFYFRDQQVGGLVAEGLRSQSR